MNTTPFTPVSRETLLAAAARAGPQTAVLLTLLAHQGQDHRLKASPAKLASQTRYSAEVVASILLGLEEAGLVVTRPKVHLGDLDTDLVIMVIHRAESPRFSPNFADSAVNVRRSFDRSVVDVNVLYVNKKRERNGACSNRPGDNSVENPRASPSLHDQETWAEQTADLLGDRENLACYRAFVRRYERPILERALKIASSCPAERITNSRGALFVSLVKRFSEGSPSSQHF